MTRTPEEGERIEKQPEEHRQSLQEPRSQNQPAGDDFKRVTVAAYFPEIFLG